MRPVTTRAAATRGLAALLVSCLFASIALANDPDPFPRRNPVTEAVKKTKQSIVCIRVPRPDGAKDMIGSGVIVDERGIIVTNRHVVGGKKSVTVCLHNGAKVEGDVLAGDQTCDLAIVRIQSDKKLTALPLAPVNDLMVGETVIAIGHP